MARLLGKGAFYSLGTSVCRSVDQPISQRGIATGAMPPLRLDAAYRDRLHSPPTDPLPPDGITLRRLVEAHLRYIPFENLSLHGCRPGGGDDEPPIPLSLPLLHDKILRRKRGGCCFELNGLLGHYLLELGYFVKLVPCWIYAGPERGHSSSRRAKFRTRQTHAFLLARTPGVEESFIVDVGLGEPPLHPLRYGPSVLGVTQRTPDGMQSRVVQEEREWTDGDGRVRRCLRLEWWRTCRACFTQKCGGNNSRRGDRDADDSGGVSNDLRNLEREAKVLRSKADRASRKTKAKPRPPFKVYAATPSIREEAKSRLLMRRQNHACATATANGCATNEFDHEIRREICDMWAVLSGNERGVYKEMALAETTDLKRDAESAEEKAMIAEASLAAAIRRGSNESASSCISIQECSESCTGEGGWWEPRIQWDISDAPLLKPLGTEQSFVEDRPLESFDDATAIIASDGSTFRSKIVICRLTRSEKITLTGNNLRITSPRFPSEETSEKSGTWPLQTRKKLSSKEDILSVLADRFGLPVEQLSGLECDVGDASSPVDVEECRLWEHL